MCVTEIILFIDFKNFKKPSDPNLSLSIDTYPKRPFRDKILNLKINNFFAVIRENWNRSQRKGRFKG